MAGGPVFRRGNSKVPAAYFCGKDRACWADRQSAAPLEEGTSLKAAALSAGQAASPWRADRTLAKGRFF